MRRLTYFCFLLFLVLPFSASASYITYYTLSPPWDENARGATPLDACKTYNPNPNATYRFNGQCYRTIWGSESFIGYAVANTNIHCPFGNTGLTCNASCDLPKTMVDGQCVTPPEDPCLSKNGQSQAFTKSGSSGDGYGTVSGGYVAGVQSACFGGCAVSTADQKCVGRVSGLYTCRGTAYYSGSKCSTTGAGTEIQENTSQDPPPVPQVITDNKPCVYSGTGDTQTCTSSEGSEKEGQYCGTVNGVKKCVDSKPTKNGIDIQTTFKTETQPDGSKTTTKTDVATKTTCTGAGQCSSTSTTTTTTTKIDGNGKTTSVTGSCTGEACPDKNGNPDGDGDGFGDCVGDDCGDSGGGSVEAPELEEQPGYGDSLQTYFDDIQGAPIVQAVTAISLPSGGNCPIYSATIDYVGTVSTATACDLASNLLTPLHYLFLAIWAFVAVRTTMTA